MLRRLINCIINFIIIIFMQQDVKNQRAKTSKIRYFIIFKPVVSLFPTDVALLTDERRLE